VIIRPVVCSSCGMAPLDPDHLTRAERDPVCAERVRDVRLLAELRRNGEDRPHMPPRSGAPDARHAPSPAHLAS
jgi:hypothetical protein